MFVGKLYKPQIPAAEKLVNRRKFLLAWEQGTGKTVIAIAAIAKLFELSKARTALVVAPTSIAWQWQDKIHELTTLKAGLVEANKKKLRADYEKTLTQMTDGVLVVPYSLFRRDFTKLKKIKWDIVIADEAQEFSNNATQTAKKIKAFNQIVNPTYRWALTGTSISNKLEELYSIMYWVDRNFLPPWPVFETRHIVRNEFGAIYKYQNLKALNEYLQVRMDRKTHADMAGQMPELLEVIHKIEHTKDYIEAEQNLLVILDDFVDSITFDSEGNPKLPGSSKVRKAYHKAAAALISDTKLKAAERLTDQILEENPSNRVVIFCKYKDPLYNLGWELRGKATYFTGDQPLVQRRHNIEQFRSGQCRVLLASNAGSTGLDLPFANYIIHLDVSPSHSLDDQRNKRITRATSVHRTAVAYYLVVENSLEEFIMLTVKRKGRLAKAVQEGTEDEVVIRPTSLRKYLRGEDD